MTTALLFSADDVHKSTPVHQVRREEAFAKLPDEIIEQILRLTTPNSFASLILLNRRWRSVSQQAPLYAYQLARCPSYSAAHPTAAIPDDEASLLRLRRLFAREVKRNLFEAYLRPRETIISLVSTSISSSSAPGGEAFHFSLSPRGHYLLAYSSSRIHVIDVTGPEVTVIRELKILRRPASTTITDDGSLLAVLSTDLRIDLYDLRDEHPKHTRAIALDHTPRTIALSRTGSVLAAAYDSGVEVSSLNATGTTTDRRAVKCYAVDALSFSKDGTQLLGSTVQSRNPSTVVLTAPYYDPGGNLPEDSVSALWTTSILFPNGSRDCSHTVLLPNPSEGEASWTFTYDRVFEIFRAVRIDDLRNGTTYFTGPIADSALSTKLLPSTLPATNVTGDLVASGFQSAIWLYGIPEDLDALPHIRDAHSNTESGVGTPAGQLARRNSAPSLHSAHKARESMSRAPQWQLLCDRFRNTFVEGRKISSLDRVSAMTWVNTSSATFHGERLVAVAPGVGSHSPISEDDSMLPTDGGRISILDFDYSPDDGKRRVMTIEVGMQEPEILEEEHRDLATEVAIVRRRTTAQRKGVRSQVTRSITSAAPRSPRSGVPPMPAIPDLQDACVSSRGAIVRRQSQQTTSSETTSVDDESEAFDAPYSHTSPRSGTTLRRAATAAAVNRRLHPRAVAQEHIEYRRADGREEHPHESDADNWVPPPPPYTRDPIPPLPEHIQRSLLAEAAAATSQRTWTHRRPSVEFPGLDSGTLHRSRTIATMASTSTGDSRRERFPFHRSMSESTNMAADRVSLEEDRPRPVTSPTSTDFDELYDVSPPATPQPSPPQIPSPQPAIEVPPSRPSEALASRPALRSPPINQIPRRPVGASSRCVSEPLSTPPIMAGRLLQPISPIAIPLPSPPLDETLERRSQNMEDTQALEHPMQSMNMPPRLDVALVAATHSRKRVQVEDSFNRSQARLSNSFTQEVAQRPEEAHHLTELPPTTPILQPEQDATGPRSTPIAQRSETVPVNIFAPSEDMRVEPLNIWKRAETAPAIPEAQRYSTPGLDMPSHDQIARLNSRKGRPTGLTDPRRVSGGSSHNRSPSGGTILHPSPRLTPEQAFNGSPSRHGNYTPSNRSITPSNPAYQSNGSPHSSSPSRWAVNGSHHRNLPADSPPSHLRPPLQRLETIHSQSSMTPEPSPYLVQKSLMAGRHPRRAENSAARNIQDAKKKGWRASMRHEKKDMMSGVGEGASSAGWPDVTGSPTAGAAGKKAKKEKTGKCALM